MKTNTNTNTKVKFTDIMKEYGPRPYDGDDDDMIKLKAVIDTLDPIDKTLLILYCEEGSMVKTGLRLGVSDTTIFLRIRKIREEIKNKLK